MMVAAILETILALLRDFSDTIVTVVDGVRVDESA